jgi:hypothetical protein
VVDLLRLDEFLLPHDLDAGITRGILLLDQTHLTEGTYLRGNVP